MKKLMLILMAMTLCLPSAMSQNKKIEKERAKVYKAKLKEFTKEGWQVYGTSRTLKLALLEHYDHLKALGENGYEIVGTATKFISKNIGHQACMNNAINNYAQQANSQVKARITSDMSLDQSSEAEFDRFYAAYERTLQTEVRGELQESFCIYRPIKGTNQFEMQTFFVVNEEAALKARIRAMENALKESEAAQRYAEKVSDFVRDGFK